MIAFDIESDKFSEFNGKPIDFKFGCAREFDFDSISNFHVFYSQTEMVSFFSSFIDEKRKTGHEIIYAHNLKYDFSFAFKYFIDLGYLVKPIENGGKLIQARICKKYKKKQKGVEVEKVKTLLEFRDSFALFPVSLKKVGEFAGLAKIDNDKEFKEITQEDIDYCVRDCDIICKAIQKFNIFFQAFFSEIPDFPLTTASAAFNIFLEKTGGKKKNRWINTDYRTDDIFKQWFFGGRTEVFSYQSGPAKYCDVKSLYGSIMAQNVFPLPPYHSFDCFEETNFPEFVFGYECILDESSRKFPLIPERTELGLTFAAKLKQAFLFNEEIGYLEEQGLEIVRIRGWYSLYQQECPFEYLQEFYELKEKKDSLALVYKLFINGSYGRFGIDKLKDVVEYVNPETFQPDGPYQFDDDCQLIINRGQREIQFAKNQIIASKITALARLYLTSALDLCHQNGYKPLYCDTDSIVCAEIPTCLRMGKNMGDWDVENDFAYFQAISVKEYFGILQTGEMITKIKGVNKPNLLKLVEYHTLGVMCHSIAGIKQIIRKDRWDVPHNILTLKEAKTVYWKRKINGLETEPLKLEEINIEENVDAFNHIWKKFLFEISQIIISLQYFELNYNKVIQSVIF